MMIDDDMYYLYPNEIIIWLLMLNLRKDKEPINTQKDSFLRTNLQKFTL